MNIFDNLLFDVILILFPFLFYMVYLFTNKNINNNCKELMFTFSLLSSSFLVIKYNYNNNNNIVDYLLLSSIILVLYLRNHYIVSNIIVLLLFVYYNINMILFLPYAIIIFLYLIKKIKGMSDFLFIDIFLLLELICVCFVKFNFNTFFMYIFSYLIIYIIYLLINKSEEIIKYHMDFKELQNQKQISLSLFKITHEIKNPIAVCKGYLDMLDANNKEQVNKYVPIIKGEIERLLVLLEDFMLVNKNNVDLDIMDINMLLEEVTDKLKPMLDEKNIKLNSDLIDDEIYIYGDYKRLSQVFINLIKNSIEAIPNSRNGIITIKNKIINNNLNIVIEDNGIGINNKILERIKEPFYTTKIKGTGLGVSLSNEIIGAHRGTLDYYSKEGINTQAIINLPLYNET